MPPKRKRDFDETPTERTTRPRRDGVSYELKATTKRAPKGAAPKRVAKRDRTPPPSLNPLPTPPDHPRPPRQLFVWGAGGMGQLGMGPDFLDEVAKPKLHKWCQEAIAEDMFGGDGAGIESVAAGGMHSFMIDEEGKVWSWGVNDDAALGRQTKDVKDANGNPIDADELSYTPHVVEDLVKQNFRAVQVLGGDSIGAVLNGRGQLRIWGSFKTAEGHKAFSSLRRRGEPPSKAATESFRPVELPSIKDKHFSTIACGDNHLIALTVDGHVYTWGTGEQGQVGRLVLERHKHHGMEPERLDIKDAVAVGAGGFHSFAILENGTVLAWGLNNWGQLGFESNPRLNPRIHIQYETVDDLDPEVTGSRVVKISGGEHHTLFLLEDGRVFAAGRCDGGQLGIPRDSPAFKLDVNKNGGGYCIYQPVPIQFDEPVADIYVASRKNLVLTRGGKLYSWGQGDLGIDEQTDVQWTPALIAGKPNAKWTCLSASIGGQHTLALFKKKVDENKDAMDIDKPLTNGAAEGSSKPLGNGVNGRHH